MSILLGPQNRQNRGMTVYISAYSINISVVIIKQFKNKQPKKGIDFLGNQSVLCKLANLSCQSVLGRNDTQKTFLLIQVGAFDQTSGAQQTEKM